MGPTSEVLFKTYTCRTSFRREMVSCNRQCEIQFYSNKFQAHFNEKIFKGIDLIHILSTFKSFQIHIGILFQIFIMIYRSNGNIDVGISSKNNNRKVRLMFIFSCDISYQFLKHKNVWCDYPSLQKMQKQVIYIKDELAQIFLRNSHHRFVFLNSTYICVSDIKI